MNCVIKQVFPVNIVPIIAIFIIGTDATLTPPLLLIFYYNKKIIKFKSSNMIRTLYISKFENKPINMTIYFQCSKYKIFFYAIKSLKSNPNFKILKPF